MDSRGVLRRLGSCFPLVFSFLIAALLVAPAPVAPALGVSAVQSVSGAAFEAASVEAAAVEAAPAAASGTVTTVHVEVARPAVLAAPRAPRAVVVVVAPLTLHDKGVRASAAQRGPPHHSA